MSLDEYVAMGRQRRAGLPAVLVIFGVSVVLGVAQVAGPNLNDPSSSAAQASWALLVSGVVLCGGMAWAARRLYARGGQAVAIRLTQHRLLIGERALAWEDLADIAFFSWGVAWTTHDGAQDRELLRLTVTARFRLTDLAHDQLEASRVGQANPGARQALDELRTRRSRRGFRVAPTRQE